MRDAHFRRAGLFGRAVARAGRRQGQLRDARLHLAVLHSARGAVGRRERLSLQHGGAIVHLRGRPDGRTGEVRAATCLCWPCTLLSPSHRCLARPWSRLRGVGLWLNPAYGSKCTAIEPCLARCVRAVRERRCWLVALLPLYSFKTWCAIRHAPRAAPRSDHARLAAAALPTRNAHAS